MLIYCHVGVGYHQLGSEVRLQPYLTADFDQANNLSNGTDWTFLDDETDMDTLWSMWEKIFMMEFSIQFSPLCQF